MSEYRHTIADILQPFLLTRMIEDFGVNDGQTSLSFRVHPVRLKFIWRNANDQFVHEVSINDSLKLMSLCRSFDRNDEEKFVDLLRQQLKSLADSILVRSETIHLADV